MSKTNSICFRTILQNKSLEEFPVKQIIRSETIKITKQPKNCWITPTNQYGAVTKRDRINKKTIPMSRNPIWNVDTLGSYGSAKKLQKPELRYTGSDSTKRPSTAAKQGLNSKESPLKNSKQQRQEMLESKAQLKSYNDNRSLLARNNKMMR